MNQKLIFLDIDGTLTRPGSNVPPDSALEAIRRAQANGHKVLLCTGRNLRMLSPLLGYGFDGLIGSAGGYIKYGEEVVYQCPMTPEQQERVLTAFRNCDDLYITIECQTNSYVDPRIKDLFRKIGEAAGNSELLRVRKQIEADLGFLPLDTYRGEPIYKVVFMGSVSQLPDSLTSALEEDFQFCMQGSSWGPQMNGELINRKFNKGIAIRRLCDHLNVPVSDTVAFGDSMNDLEMLQTAGLSVCMENGHPDLKAVADDICPAVDQDGLYRAFEKHGLI